MKTREELKKKKKEVFLFFLKLKIIFNYYEITYKN